MFYYCRSLLSCVKMEEAKRSRLEAFKARFNLVTHASLLSLPCALWTGIFEPAP
jgi:hypothetical protein